jgi:hypothetical protein
VDVKLVGKKVMCWFCEKAGGNIASQSTESGRRIGIEQVPRMALLRVNRGNMLVHTCVISL